MLKCIKCGKFRKEKDFDPMTQMCKHCAPKQQKTHMKYGKFIQDLKHEAGCFFCEEDNPVALDYHHVHSGTKSFGLGSVRGQSAEEIFEEIKKCVVLCSNCHRKLHAGHLNLPKSKLKEYDRYSPHG